MLFHTANHYEEAVGATDTLRANPVEFANLYLWNIIQPTGILWLVHMLAAAALQMAH